MVNLEDPGQALETLKTRVWGLGFRGVGFRGLGFRGLGFIGFRGLVFWGSGLGHCCSMTVSSPSL